MFERARQLTAPERPDNFLYELRAAQVHRFDGEHIVTDGDPVGTRRCSWCARSSAS
jgi:hypothetical protein